MVKSHDHQSGTKMLLHRHLLEDTFRYRMVQIIVRK